MNAHSAHDRRARRACLAITVASMHLASACATPPPPPGSPDSAMIGVRVALSESFGLFETPCEQVYFVRMDDNGSFAEDQVIPSNFTTDGYVFLMNAEPGTYAAIAAARTVTSPAGPTQPAREGFSTSFSLSLHVDTLTYLPQDVVSHTVVRVEPGSAAYMGDYVLEQSTDFGDADETQIHYFGVLQPDQVGRSALGQIFTGEVGYRGTLSEEDRGPTALGRFVKRAGSRLNSAGWSRALAHPIPPALD